MRCRAFIRAGILIWRELVHTGIYKRGPDLSETGSTWLESLYEMNVLRPFTRQEVDAVGGEDAYIAAAFNGVKMGKENEKQVYGIPSRIDSRVIYYWKDMLAAAHLDPQTAFASLDQLPTTFEKLKSVIPTPWAAASSPEDPATIQTLTTWVWQCGEDFVSPNGKQVTIDSPAVLDALTAYFNLYRYCPRQLNLSGQAVSQLFTDRKVAVVIGGPWVYTNLQEMHLPPEQFAQVGVATIPGPSFVGGMALVIFQHTRQDQAALRLVEFLTRPDVQVEYAPMVGLLPARHAAWNRPPLSTDPFFQTIYQSLLSGRSFPAVPLWGTMEDRLIKTFAAIWNELMTHEAADSAQVVRKYLVPLAVRLNSALDR